MNRQYKLVRFLLAALCCLVAAATAVEAGTPFQDSVDYARKCGVSSDAISLVATGVVGREISEADGEALLQPLLTACSESLPLASFEDKLAEGLAKHVPPARIVYALERRLDDYLFVRNLLSSRFDKVPPELLDVMAEGVSQGTPRADLASYLTDFSDRAPAPFLTGAHMICLLGQSGFDYGLSRSMLKIAFADGGPAPEWRFFIRTVLVARKRGLADVEIADAARRVLKDGGSLNDVSSRLGFTSRSLTGRPDSN